MMCNLTLNVGDYGSAKTKQIHRKPQVHRLYRQRDSSFEMGVGEVKGAWGKK
jgi:hypothetical protein